MLREPLMSRDYTHGLRLGGVKLTLDGSPQDKTAWFTKPYFHLARRQTGKLSRLPRMTDEQAAKWVEVAYRTIGNCWSTPTGTLPSTKFSGSKNLIYRNCQRTTEERC